MHGRHGRGPGGSRGRRRQGRTAHLLEPAILICLLRGPAHGYALAEQLTEFNLDQVALRRIYRMLQGMQEFGWISSDWETQETQGPPRRIYGLTAEGNRVLADWMESLRESREAIDSLLVAYQQGTKQ